MDITTLVAQPQVEFSEGPRELTPQNVQYFSHHTQEFAHSQVHKAQKFVEHGCIEYAGDGFFVCKPILGYNTRTYTMRKNSAGSFECNCQKAREGAESCSHILALFWAFKLGIFRNKYPEVVLE